MKYISYTLIVLWTVIRKIPLVIPYILLILPFRRYARNTVYNYVLANGIYLQRLLERPIAEHDTKYIIAPYHNTDGGYINKRDVSWLEYKLVYYFLWQWYDDDSNRDTTDIGYINTILNGERMTWLPEFIINELADEVYDVPKFGNAFDLGDDRANYPFFGFWSFLLWTIRNTAYNSKYMTWEKKAGDSGIWYKKIGRYEFGWKQDEHNPDNYSLVVGVW